MKYRFAFLLVFIFTYTHSQLPGGFIYVKDLIPNIKVELRYNGANNFIGQQIEGYKSNKLILTVSAAEALKKVQSELETQGFCLLVYDGYRPQRAVNHFIEWAIILNDTINKYIFYPNVEKKNLFQEGYISTRSGHSRGSTVDITIFDDRTNEPLDMGSPYDFFGETSWVDFDGITSQQKANRQLLQKLMIKHGFRIYTKEWWHFTLRDEPFPDTYFDFIIQ